MKGYLLDTHVLVWWLAEPGRLSEAARAAIADPRNLIYFSTAGVWELMIKQARGSITLPGDLSDVLREDQLDVLSIDLPHVLALGDLPAIHQDPFDRVMVAQAVVEDLTLVTRNGRIQQYPVRWMAA